MLLECSYLFDFLLSQEKLAPWYQVLQAWVPFVFLEGKKPKKYEHSKSILNIFPTNLFDFSCLLKPSTSGACTCGGGAALST